MLDRLPRPLRHLVILLLGAAVSWAGTDLVPAVGPWLAARPPLGPLAGALLAQLLLAVLPIVRYRLDALDAEGDAPRHAA